MTEKKENKRRSFLVGSLRAGALLLTGSISGFLFKNIKKRDQVWQIDPDRCNQCERCSTECVLEVSAVKCVHAFDVCGYCKLCGGYSIPDAKVLDTAAENQLCPTGAIKRTFIEDPYYEYTIIEDECIGCAKCVKGCGAFGNGSLYLQVRHDRCLNCNECSIAKLCPSDAFVRISADKPYLLRGKDKESLKT